MDVKKYFEYTPDLELIVAQIGINKWDWQCVERNDEILAKRIMTHNRFDILPISTKNGVTHYFQTERWGDFSTVKIREIGEEDVIYYRLSFIDLIRKMINEKRNHYFLVDSSEILGLVSLNNLNSIPVYNYIYQITASLEQLVSNYLRTLFDEEEVLEWLKASNDQLSKKVVWEFIKLKEKNADNSIFDHLYFPSLGTILKKGELILKQVNPELLNYRTKFCAGNLYWEIRNTVAHPVKSLFVDATSVQKLYELISDYTVIKRLVS